jgi:branched-chain amino acid transport system ATP-binding protein
VLHGVDLAVHPGEIVALLGPNGAGKSTPLGAMSGRLDLTGGCRHVMGRHLNGARTDELARIGVSLVREGRSVYPNLSVADNLAVAASAGVPVPRMQEQAYDLFPRLGERRAQLAGTMSGGEKQMLALACGLGAEPAVLLIDELSMGLAPIIVENLYDVVSQVAAGGVSVLLVEQFANVGLQVGDRVYVMAHGNILYEGGPVGAEAAIEAAYLGGAA